MRRRLRTLIGEELYAVSAYLSRDPRLVSSLKASDMVKLAAVAVILIGTITVFTINCGTAISPVN